MRPLFGLRLPTLFLTACWLLPATSAHAEWPHDPGLGYVPVSIQTSIQYAPVAMSDGAGGMFVAWVDQRSGGDDVYVQRIRNDGTAVGTANGVPVCTSTSAQDQIGIVSDGAGGAILCWRDNRSGSTDIYAQRVNSSCTRLWATNGIAVCTATNSQATPAIVSDGLGGAIITWADLRGGLNYDLYAQRINASGVAQWTANGVAVCTATGDQTKPVIVNDQHAGAWIAWTDDRSTTLDVYAQWLNGGGTPQMLANGATVCNASADQTDVRAVPDGLGGAIFAWKDSRGANAPDIYAQHYFNGESQWNFNGVPVCTATGSQSGLELASDGAGGAYAAWSDLRGSTSDIYAQRIHPSGGVAWTTDGVAVCTSSAGEGLESVAPDGSGGLLLVWHDTRGGINFDLYAQRVAPTGTSLWTFNGVAVSTGLNYQIEARIVDDGNAGALIAWSDARFDPSDVLAGHVHRYGQLGSPEPAITSVRDVPFDQGGVVKLSWDASYLDVDPTFGVFDYRIWRSVPPNAAALRARRAGATPDPDAAAADGGLLVGPYATAGYAWEFVGTMSAGLLPSYSYLVPTLQDSVAGGNPRTAFMVEGRSSTSVSGDHWYSAPDSGYSVDNLGPVTPAPFTGQYGGAMATLHWNPNHEADLAGYRLYRGPDASFVPTEANRIAALADTGYTDTGVSPQAYKLTAVDVHGNESPVATWVATGTTGVGEGGAMALAFAAPAPNPSRGAVTLRFALPSAGDTRVAVYDAAGRRVRVLREGPAGAGEHAVAWDGRDANGADTGAGLYFARLEAGGRTIERRIARVR